MIKAKFGETLRRSEIFITFPNGGIDHIKKDEILHQLKKDKVDFIQINVSTTAMLVICRSNQESTVKEMIKKVLKRNEIEIE
jgi:hypothetical protein